MNMSSMWLLLQYCLLGLIGLVEAFTTISKQSSFIPSSQEPCQVLLFLFC
ncbi:hypothetical protein SLEP1_g21216 [Rubroshorea leprosula]|uniref:Uncharacterized protein n=1 Tax=Rubroshorea leprosula TaxID=152421 RepID=A0AAV5JE03_9ROSI|nr:hypothetical protein SLEP1_g21216 [Rubroshorea leprosula]